MLAVNGVGKPCAGEPHARIDGRELETEHTTDHGGGEELPNGKPSGRMSRISWNFGGGPMIIRRL